MARSTSAYFLGTDTGVNSAAENAAEARFGIVGLSCGHLGDSFARGFLPLNPLSCTYPNGTYNPLTAGVPAARFPTHAYGLMARLTGCRSGLA